jgi:Lipopolysaccharide-assembly
MRAGAVLALFLAFITACGYHTAGHANLLPADLHVLAVPAFVNQTQSYKIEQMLTAAVMREFAIRTHYRVVSDPGSADATLRGTVLAAATTPLTYNSTTGQLTTALVVVSMRVVLTDQKGKILYQNPSYVFREQYQISQQLSTFLEEDTPAFKRLTAEFARNLVSDILEAF